MNSLKFQHISMVVLKQQTIAMDLEGHLRLPRRHLCPHLPYHLRLRVELRLLPKHLKSPSTCNLPMRLTHKNLQDLPPKRSLLFQLKFLLHQGRPNT